MKLVDAIRTKDTVTENGMKAHSTTLNDCVDLFSNIGAYRGKAVNVKIDAFAKAFAEDSLTALKILFWARDIRGGAGERETFKNIMLHLANNYSDSLRKNIHLIPFYGRWDDVLPLLDTSLKNDVLELIGNALNSDDSGLVAKWMPRPNVNNKDKKRWSTMIRKSLNMTSGEFRKLLASLSNTVEQLLCAKDWSEIKYSHVPSKAMSVYMKTFNRHDNDRFSSYLTSLEKGEVKINASALYPYDVIKNLRNGDARGANLQWDALPNFMENSEERIIPVIDVSGSMFWPESKVSGELYAGHIAMSMGLYVSQRNVGPFKDAILSFNSRPTLTVVKGNLSERYNQLSRIDVGGSTNIEATFDLILSKAKEFNVPQSEMPTMVLIFSDMQFNSCVSNPSDTAQEMIRRKYAEAGYELPKIVYWQTNARTSNKPVQFNEQGTALVSGFSPSLLASLIGGKEMTPFSMMMDVIGGERYSLVTV